jgi:hypothetical protein
MKDKKQAENKTPDCDKEAVADQDLIGGVVICADCNYRFDAENVIIGKHPFKENQYVYGCPKCKGIECFKLPDKYKYEEIIKQEYGGNNCKFSGGFVEGDDIDTVYLRWEKDGEQPYTLLLRPDELQAIAWIANGVLWSDAYHKLEIKDVNDDSCT